METSKGLIKFQALFRGHSCRNAVLRAQIQFYIAGSCIENEIKLACPEYSFEKTSSFSYVDLANGTPLFHSPASATFYKNNSGGILHHDKDKRERERVGGVQYNTNDIIREDIARSEEGIRNRISALKQQHRINENTSNAI